MLLKLTDFFSIIIKMNAFCCVSVLVIQTTGEPLVLRLDPLSLENKGGKKISHLLLNNFIYFFLFR